jgi:hypothetical protein
MRTDGPVSFPLSTGISFIFQLSILFLSSLKLPLSPRQFANSFLFLLSCPALSSLLRRIQNFLSKNDGTQTFEFIPYQLLFVF